MSIRKTFFYVQVQFLYAMTKVHFLSERICPHHIFIFRCTNISLNIFIYISLTIGFLFKVDKAPVKQQRKRLTVTFVQILFWISLFWKCLILKTGIKKKMVQKRPWATRCRCHWTSLNSNPCSSLSLGSFSHISNTFSESTVLLNFFNYQNEFDHSRALVTRINFVLKKS